MLRCATAGKADPTTNKAKSAAERFRPAMLENSEFIVSLCLFHNSSCVFALASADFWRLRDRSFFPLQPSLSNATRVRKGGHRAET